MKRPTALSVLMTLVVAGACSTSTKVAPATTTAFQARASADGATSITLEGAVWGRGGDTAVVFAHSYPTTQDAWAGFASQVAGRGLLVLTFNFRGYGQSQGTRDPSRADLDLEGAIAHAKSLGARRVLVVGASMGGTAALIVGSRQSLAAVVAVSAPVSFRGLDATQAVKTAPPRAHERCRTPPPSRRPSTSCDRRVPTARI
jgi:pimeloyl-ACP methyl ester carboxylesterase